MSAEIDTKGPDAVARLALSRERLRLAMLDPPPKERLVGAEASPRHPSSEGGVFSTTFVTDAVRRLFAKVRAQPAAEVVVDAVEAWWAGHPLHTAGAVAVDASRAYVQPIARRSPIALVAGSALFGAVFFLTRPWRWALRPILLAGLVPQIASQALRRAPVGTWVHLVSAFAKRRNTAAKNRPRPAPATSAPTAAADRPDATHSVGSAGTPHAPRPAGPGSPVTPAGAGTDLRVRPS